MVTEKLVKFIEDWAPPGAAWEKDNVGLQVGSSKRRITNIFLCLELTEKALREAIYKKSNFIFTHHPFIFKPLKKINIDTDPKGKLIEDLIKNNITLFSAHTNLDFTKEGVSFELARTLSISNPKFLVNEKSNQFKLVVFIPPKSLSLVANEIYNAGGGIIGEYEKCGFTLEGSGSFLGSENSNPTLGKKEKLETVNEVRLEILVDSWKLNNVIRALRKVHPYEEPAFDVYALENENMNYGFGAIGNLSKSMAEKEFLSHVCKSLKTDSVRFSKGNGKKIKTVAVCGGSGSDLLEDAVKKGADAFVTADIKYHSFQDGENRVLFVDAGHYETEIHSLNVVKRKLEKFLKLNGEPIKVFKYSGSTNPVSFLIIKELNKLINRLSTLFELQLIDDELDTLQELRGDLPLEVNNLNSQIQNIKDTVEEKEKEKEDALETIKSNESEIERLNASLKKFKSQLYQVRNNKEYDALTKEIDHSEERISTFEGENSELENRVQTLKTEIEEVTPQLEDLLAEVEIKEEELKQIVRANEREETKLSAKRGDVADKVRRSDYNTYTRIRKALGGKAVVTISRGACTGCHNVVPPQRQIEIRGSKRLFTCESCGRLLISPNVAAEVKKN